MTAENEGEVCLSCDGSGWVDDEVCFFCQGSGWIEQ